MFLVRHLRVFLCLFTKSGIFFSKCYNVTIRKRKKGEKPVADGLLEVLRTEQKYPINYAEFLLLRGKLQSLLQEDAHNGPEGYLVRSLYFDTLDDSDYMDKSGGYELRHKLRLRVYGPTDQYAKLELKEKQGDLQRKRSLLVGREDAIQLCKGNTSVLQEYEDPFAKELYTLIQERMYLPKCIVEYKRWAVMEPANDIRITFDSAITASETTTDIFQENCLLYPVQSPNQVTMEVKFNGFLFSYIKDLVSLSDKEQASVSKYVLARSIFMGLEF